MLEHGLYYSRSVIRTHLGRSALETAHFSVLTKLIGTPTRFNVLTVLVAAWQVREQSGAEFIYL